MFCYCFWLCYTTNDSHIHSPSTIPFKLYFHMLRVNLTDLPQEIGRPALHPNKINFIVNDMIEDRLLLAVKLHALPMLKDCDIMQFANLDFLPSDSMHSQKFQGRSLIRRSSTDGQFGNATGELHKFILFTAIHFSWFFPCTSLVLGVFIRVYVQNVSQEIIIVCLRYWQVPMYIECQRLF